MASLDFFFLLKSPEPARLGEDTLSWEDLERLERSNMELEMAETWLVNLLMVSGFNWLMSPMSCTRFLMFSMSWFTSHIG